MNALSTLGAIYGTFSQIAQWVTQVRPSTVVLVLAAVLAVLGLIWKGRGF